MNLVYNILIASKNYESEDRLIIEIGKNTFNIKKILH